jgi:hypothetical protein
VAENQNFSASFDGRLPYKISVKSMKQCMGYMEKAIRGLM